MKGLRMRWKVVLLMAAMFFSLFAPVASASSAGKNTLSSKALTLVQGETVSWNMTPKTFVAAYNASAKKAVKFTGYKSKASFTQSLAEGLRIRVDVDKGKVCAIMLRYDGALESAANTALALDACEALFIAMTGNDAEAANTVRGKLGLEDESAFETGDSKSAVYKNVAFRFSQEDGIWRVTAKPYEGGSSSKGSVASSASSASASSSSSSSSSASASTTTSSGSNLSEVYITETGGKYHRAGCRHLKDSKISIGESEAIAQGYEACSVCH